MEQKDSRGVVVSVGTATFRMNPVGFCIYAEQFVKAAQSVPTGSEFTPVPYYLFCRAVELILKAFLLAKGNGLDDLKDRYGHDLQALWKVAGKEGLSEVVGSLPAEIESDIALANSYYKGKAFEYFDFRRWAHGYEELPPLDRLGHSTAALVETMKAYCVRVA